MKHVIEYLRSHFSSVDFCSLSVLGIWQVASLIRLMMANSPAERPSARDLLRSDLLPPTVADEAVSDLLRSLPDAPDMLERVVDAIFSLPDGAAQSAQAQEEPGGPASVQVGRGLLPHRWQLRWFGRV